MEESNLEQGHPCKVCGDPCACDYHFRRCSGCLWCQFDEFEKNDPEISPGDIYLDKNGIELVVGRIICGEILFLFRSTMKAAVMCSNSDLIQFKFSGHMDLPEKESS